MRRFELMACLMVIGMAAAAMPVGPRPYYGKIAQRVANMLPKYHVLQCPMDDEISRRAWTNLVTFYDYDHSVFLKGDLDRLAARETTLDDELASYRYYYLSFLLLLLLHFTLTYVCRLLITSRTVRLVHTRQIGFPTLLIGTHAKAYQT